MPKIEEYACIDQDCHILIDEDQDEYTKGHRLAQSVGKKLEDYALCHEVAVALREVLSTWVMLMDKRLQNSSESPNQPILLERSPRMLKALHETLLNPDNHEKVSEFQKCSMADIKVSNKLATRLQKVQSDRDYEHSQETIRNVCKFLSERENSGRERIAALLKMISSHIDHNIKDIMLPLHGHNLWQEWAVKDKEEHRQLNRGGMRIEQYSAKIGKQKEVIRKLQFDQAQNLSPVMSEFLRALLKTEGRVRNYFLQCLKLHLNDVSRDSISSLQHKYKEARDKLLDLQAKKDPNKSQLQHCRDTLQHFDKKIVNASLGLEHLMRELGQLYEATSGTQAIYPQLPRIAADLLVEGYPLEIMDGDAAHVPKRWVAAVLNEVVKICGDYKTFVLSVVGLQSTGKSTLMNTTFGLQFNVSAGRCTRGAFMQLLTVDGGPNKKEHILVVDTEGLRAPELDSQQTRKHDNELATFVIGLANLTMINIFGEAPGDMDDILQTVVHAFLRMKTVNLTPSCLFVHQNVGALMASKKVGIGRSKLKDKLDKMTCEAAKEEKCEGEYEYFSDVISYDEKTDAHFFPGLWVGDPPMAPLNPGYSKNAMQLKSQFMHKVDNSQKNKLSDIAQRIMDLWNALLHEKFVFSFKNVLEIIAYNSLEAKFIEWALRFKAKVFDWERKSGIEIKNAQMRDLKTVTKRLVDSELPTLITGNRKQLEQEIETFFEESDHSSILIQWQGETISRLKRLALQLKVNATKSCTEASSSQEARDKVQKMNASYQEEILEKVKQLVATFDRDFIEKSHESQDEVKEILEATFDQEWEQWISDLKAKATVYREDVDVCGTVQASLTEFHKSQEHLVLIRLQEKELRDWGRVLFLELREEHAKKRKQKKKNWIVDKGTTLVNYVVHGGNESWLLNAKHKMDLQSTTEYAFRQASEYICSKRHMNFNPIYTDEILKQLRDNIDEQTSDNSALVLTKEYYVDMSLTVCGYAVMEFEDMVKRFREQNDPILHLEEKMKPHLLSLFINKYFQNADEKFAACTLCDLLKESIRSQVEESLGTLVIEDDIARKVPQFHNKSALKAKMLLDMGEQVQSDSTLLEKYFAYFENGERSMRSWIRKYTKEFCESCESQKSPRLATLACIKLKELIREIEENVNKSTEECKTDIKGSTEGGLDTSKWLKILCLKLSSTLEVSIFNTGFQDLGGVDNLKDLEYFTQEVHTGLKLLQMNLEEEFSQLTFTAIESEKVKVKPYDAIFDEICGCSEQCPFCREPCDCTQAKHKPKHGTQQHRPLCLGYFSDVHTKEMNVDLCSSVVGSDIRFRNKDTNEKFMPFKTYQEVYPKWSIPVDMSAKTSTYWKWFVGHYSKQLAARFNAKDNEVPQSWRELTWQDAKEDLQKTFRV